MKNSLLLVPLFLLLSFKHPFYLGVTDLKYNANEKALQGSVKLFTNDLEDALKRIKGQSVDLIHPKDIHSTNLILYEYLKNHLSFTINGKQQPFQLLGFEKEEEAIWMYIELKNCDVPKTIQIDNSLLYDFLPEQMHIIQVEVGATKKSFKLIHPEKKCELHFE
jgi:hypothetical protein